MTRGRGREAARARETVRRLRPVPGPRRLARAAARADTREALVWCGTELLTERGFQVTGIEEVLQRTGVPKGSFYHFFPSKHAFGEAVIQNYRQYYARKMDRIFDQGTRAPLDRLRDFVDDATRGMLRHDFRKGCLIGNLGQELASLDDAFRTQLEEVLGSWEDRVEKCLADAVRVGQLPPESDPAALSRVFWIGWEGAILRSKLTRDVRPLEQFARFYFETLCAPPARRRRRRG
jgi:TetR/AcrR family transcriptional regulator, transcriptional repressor for nem operon